MPKPNPPGRPTNSSSIPRHSHVGGGERGRRPKWKNLTSNKILSWPKKVSLRYFFSDRLRIWDRKKGLFVVMKRGGFFFPGCGDDGQIRRLVLLPLLSFSPRPFVSAFFCGDIFDCVTKKSDQLILDSDRPKKVGIESMVRVSANRLSLYPWFAVTQKIFLILPFLLSINASMMFFNSSSSYT